MTATEQVSEQQAREFAEQARETQWRQPSFGKELFLGRLRLDLVHPQPSGLAEAEERGNEFLAKLREFCDTQIDAAALPAPSSGKPPAKWRATSSRVALPPAGRSSMPAR